MANSDEIKVENLFIAMLGTDSTLLALAPGHRGSEAPNTPVSVSVSAIKGEASYERIGAHWYKVEVRIDSNNADAATLDDLASRVDAVIPVEPGDTTSVSLAAFQYFRIENEIESERPVDAETRSRTRIFPVIAQDA